MPKIATVKIELQNLPMSQRKHVGVLCLKCMENKDHPGTVDDLQALLQRYIEAHEKADAARWLLVRLKTDELAPINYRHYINRLLYE